MNILIIKYPILSKLCQSMSPTFQSESHFVWA